ncbi:hypothetical protein J4228_02660 [Candidatus Woesearchaeota archaeon]|nr:hypothetical protein [Candidatus Woesearchaeota archaeon]
MINRKGSLNLSIEAIVVIVIAFVVLGLGLGFVRSQFKDIGGTTKTVQEQIRQQLLDDLRTGDKRLSFPATEVNLAKKESIVTAIGVKNVKQGTLKFKVIVQSSGGDSIFGTEINDNFLYAAEVDELPPTESRIIPVRITSETLAGTGQFKILIQDVTDPSAETVYDSKTFFITVTG